MRVLCTIIQPFMLPVVDAHQDFLLGGAIAGKFIGDDHARDIRAPFQQFSEEPLGCSFVATALYKNIEHGAVLVDGPPQIVLLAVDLQKNFINVPLISGPRTSTPKLIGILLTEFSVQRRTVS